MLRPLIAGNWKMHTDINHGAKLVEKLRELVGASEDVEVLIAPPTTSIHHLHFLVAGSPIKLAAQNIHWETEGAYTGEITAEMAHAAGCEYVIIGHSERRAYFGETDEWVHKKLIAAVRGGLKPIVCLGESLEEREAGKALEVIATQLKGALKTLAMGVLKDLVIAYEPVWAIGTGKTASPDEAEEVHAAIREQLYDMLGTEAKVVRIIYGGSVKAANIDELMGKPNIDGALVGGASLKPEDFARIVNFEKS
ncbi:MAG: triose-phosphate isomerase [Deltaproteobacteria bacterium]|nr:triose-phosphate isomerase [Deltaproteobacteria bacterium]